MNYDKYIYTWLREKQIDIRPANLFLIYIASTTLIGFSCAFLFVCFFLTKEKGASHCVFA